MKHGLILRGMEPVSFPGASSLALGTIQLPFQWVHGVSSSGVKRLSLEDDSLHLMPGLRVSGAVPPLSHIPWCTQRLLF